MKDKTFTVLWRANPSALQFAHHYVAVFLLSILLIFLQYKVFHQPFALIFDAVSSGHFFNLMFDSWKIAVLSLMDLSIVFLVIYALYKILQTKLTEYILTEEQVIINSYHALGMQRDFIELYRIVDYQLHQNFIYMICHISSVLLHTRDRNLAILEIAAIKDGRNIMSLIRDQVEKMRKQKGVKEFIGGAAPR
ncbi:MAG: hypothetical protein COB50_00595 [Thiotrichales bacterium]|nr:MAG: hypothetical protein COB50_00595 [Thiotrichales bacterium]